MAFQLDEAVAAYAGGSIEKDIEYIQHAIYGREVRAAIAEAILLLHQSTSSIVTINEALSSAVAALQENAAATAETIAALETSVTDLGSRIDGVEANITDLGSRIDGVEANITDLGSTVSTMQEQLDVLASGAVVCVEPAGDLTATVYGDGSFLVAGNGAADAGVSDTFTSAVTSRYSIDSTWRIGEGVTSLCDSYMGKIGSYVALHTEKGIPCLSLPTTLVQIGTYALASPAVSYAGTMAQWRQIQNSAGEPITSAIFFMSVQKDARIYCTDGTLQYDSTSQAWEEVTL